MGRSAKIGLFLLMGLVVALARLIEVEVGKVRPLEESPAALVLPKKDIPPHKKKKPSPLEHARHAVKVAVAPMPPPPAPPKPASSGDPDGAEWPQGPIYVVKKGETLGVIAQKVLGTSKLASRLYESNATRISNPDFLKPGTKLVVPTKD